MRSYLFYVLVLLPLVFGCQHKEEKPFYVQTALVSEGATKEEIIDLSGRILPHPRQMEWFRDEFMALLCYGPNTFTGVEWGSGFEDPTVFNPSDQNTDQWCEVMAAAGIKRVVVVIKHHDGYCLWPTRYTSHSVVSSPWKGGKGDVMKDLSQSCRKYGLKLGFYLSPADLYQIESPDGIYGNRSTYRERTIPSPVEGRPFKDKRTFSYRVDDYNEYFLNQLYELMTEYGPIYEVWFDGAHPKKKGGQQYTYDLWYDMIRQLAPHAVIFGKGPDARWCGNEGGATREAEHNVIPLEVSPDRSEWPDLMAKNLAGRDKLSAKTRFLHYYPAETNTSIRHGWFWRNEDEQQVRSADDIFDIYERSVGGNSAFLLGITPDTIGKLPTRDSEALKEVGKRIRQVYGTDLLKGANASVENILDGQNDTWWEAKEKPCSIEISLKEEIKMNRFVVKEALEFRGERVEEHVLDAWIDGAWKEIAQGKTIGYKKILRFPVVETRKLRLRILKARLNPVISEVSAHYYNEPPKMVKIKRDANGLVQMGVGTGFSWKNHNTSDQSQEVYYTLDGSEPNKRAVRYEGPFSLPKGGRLKARSYVGERSGSVVEKWFGIVKNGWQASAASMEGKEALLAIDDKSNTGWVSKKGNHPHQLAIDMQQVYQVIGFKYRPLPHQGLIENFRVEVSEDGGKWEKAYQGKFGNIKNDPSERIVLFDGTFKARYLRLISLSGAAGEKQAGVAELHILGK